ncbi:probable disease resistance protein At4g27220 isoform X2 [Eucalyptus grandis]|uniref:probable disease resistance protein At4g27220 isoform X2 n=1 Tax=Eucalyptus grandis TaxID=71139 RepID=UPI00192EA38B|nr:probable disease resistance protein At4g27220 isoform X2 [Eucalyptus grandis]
MSSTRTERRLELPELDKANLDKTINTSQRTVKERRLGLSKSDQSAKFKKSARVRTTTIDGGSGDFLEIVDEFTGIHPAGGGGEREKGLGYGNENKGSPCGAGFSQITFFPNHLKLPRRPPPLDLKYFPKGFRRLQLQEPFHCRKSDERIFFKVRVVPAPKFELPPPPDDGFSWRKYDQKENLGAKYPRNYYRCTHGKDRGCLARKRVQRSDDDPSVFEVTYCRAHTCNHHSLQIIQPQTQPQQNQTHLQDIAFDFRGSLTVITPNLDSNNDDHNFCSSMFNFPPTSDNTSSVMSNNSNFPSTPQFLSRSTSETNYLSESPARLEGFQVGPSFGTSESELAMIVLAATSENNSQATRREKGLPKVNGAYHGSESHDNEMQLLIEEKSISDQPVASSVDTSISLGSGLCSRAIEDQKELNPSFGIDLLHTKAGSLTNEGSLLSNQKEEENVTVSSEVKKLEATQKQRAESDFVPMQNTWDTETELFPWLVKRDADPHPALEEFHTYSFPSESEVGSHCSELESEDKDKKIKIGASPEYHKRETSESAVLQMQNPVEREVELFSLEVKEDTASDEVHSISLEVESEVDSYCSGPEYEVGDKKARIEASPEYDDIMHTPKLKKESSSHATLDNSDASIDMLDSSGKQEGRPSEGWGAINYDSIVYHLIKSIKKSNIEKLGIYGRNEVGKAIVVRALKESAILRNLFDRVICITVPQNCDMEMVQKEIAGQISSDLTEVNAVDMPHSVVNALSGLKFLLILVGTNQHLRLETLKIPVSAPPVGSKIVFVAESEQLCDEIEVDKKICLDDLLLCELFRQNVGEVVYHPKKALAKEIVRMCRHYSHAVILVARALQNVDDDLIWKRVLERLAIRPASHDTSIEALMVNVLRFSIDQLENDKTRRCLKNLALCDNYHEIASESAIGLWVRDGIVDNQDEGLEVLKNLVNANLLEIDDNGQFVKFQDQDQDILVNLIFQPEENRMFLMQGGLDVTEPPEIEKWESAKEILLMQTGISELPKEPRCPSLSSLYLQRNYKVRKLSSSFFNQMPALEVLNLSRTRIRCLPESISQLVSLKRFFLNDCVLLRSISPAIGRLKQLEVFDLEGTKIKNLPKEIECLINLTCLGISLSGTEPSNDSKTVIPHGVISSLLHLEELNLDVDADSEWWHTCAEGVVSEVCNLKSLSAFKFSFPTLELLRQFNQLRKSMEHPSLAQFRLCVGNHASCMMNQLPLDIELELERCNRFLRYTNGDGVFTEIKDVLRQSDAFFLERHANLKKLSELGIDSMDQLKWCVMGECNELEVLVDASDTLHQEALTGSHYKSICLESLEFLFVYYMRNLRNIWKGAVSKGCLSSLKLLTLCKCPELTSIFSHEMLDNLNNLEEVTIEDCPAIASLISCQTSIGKVRETPYFLPILKKLSLHYVRTLSSISCGLRIAPRLERLSFYDCPSLRSLSTDEVSSEHLKKIKGERSWWKDLEWCGHKPDHLDGIFIPIDTCDIP